MTRPFDSLGSYEEAGDSQAARDLPEKLTCAGCEACEDKAATIRCPQCRGWFCQPCYGSWITHECKRVEPEGR